MGKTIMRKSRLTVIPVCATLLWAGAVHAKPSPLTCAQRQVQDVNELTFELNLGQLLCTADLTTHDCGANVCSPEAFPATGQTTSYVAGDDGAIKAGAPLSYTDNGDGTITDNNTKLMWEKKDQASGGLHNMGNRYPWAGLCQDGVTLCGTSADCSAQTPTTCTATYGQTGLTIFGWVAQLNAAKFAGYTDWRIPNIKELESIVDYQNLDPTVDAAFNTSCSPGCTVTTCSCTQSILDGFYWSATTTAGSPPYAWFVFFVSGGVGDAVKTVPSARPVNFYVRAVRTPAFLTTARTRISSARR
jgi:hypothetical protein